jgi:hypothetical protein
MFRSFLRRRPKIAYDPPLVPPLRLMLREGIDTVSSYLTITGQGTSARLDLHSPILTSIINTPILDRTSQWSFPTTPSA